MSTGSTPDEVGELIGVTLGDFVIRAKIGEGGHGSVWRAEQPALARQAVIKVMRAQLRGNEGLTQRFLREAKLASRLDHPYAAHVYAFGAEPNGLLWIAMEYVRGTPLDQLLRAQRRLPLERFVPLLDKLCEVLASAHEQGIVHRDIKPANVMVLARAGRMLPKLLDFGIAKTVGEHREDSGGQEPDGPPSELAGPIGEGEDVGRTLPGSAQEDTGPGAAALTLQGTIVGSPPYMAPEQWMNRDVGPATDLYALGVLSFEALTGVPPFGGRTALETARAHAQKPVPPLGPAFPPALDAVLRKAMAKRSGDRHRSVLEFAAEFREAAGLVGEAASLPRLNELVREAALLDAPQPIADAVAALDAATSVHQALSTIEELVAITARLVGLIAIAARTRIGKGDGDPPLLGETLRILRRRTLADREWVELARALTRAYRVRADAYPVPELVEVLAREGPEDPFTPLLDHADDSVARRGSTADARGRLEELLPLVNRLLAALAFLSDYSIVVAQGAVAQRWAGARRGSRITVTPTRPLEPGRPVLVTADAVPILQLWPLLQVDEPTPGAPPELFFFEGQGRTGARLVARPVGFDRGDDGIWDWFRRELSTTDQDSTELVVQGEAAPPYRGLDSFTAGDAAAFVGREREIASLVNRLRVHPFIAVVGPSGAGKSSFVHAGVIPNLPQGWRSLSLRPGATPLAALASALEHHGAPQGLLTRLRADPTALSDALLQASGDATLVLVIDQFEECFTLCRDEAERDQFFVAISRAVEASHERARLIITLRDDFLMRAERHERLHAHFAMGLQLLGVPSRDVLERIVTEPARRAGYEFDDRSLPAEMVADVVDQAGALPLLSFTAAKMWELRDRHFRQLTRKVYRALGGVVGALAQHAEETISELGAEEQRMLRSGFRHLVTAEGTRSTLSRAELLTVMGDAGRGNLLLEKLVHARLMTVSDGEGNAERVEIIHEALLTAWPRLVAWRQEDAEGARLRDQLRAAARQWEDRGRPDGLLWRDEALDELRAWRARHPSQLPSIDQSFAEASLAAARRSRTRVRVGLAALVCLLAVAAGTFFELSQRARANEQLARARVAELYEDQGRQSLLDGDPERALVYLLEAMRGGREGAALRFLLGRATTALAPLQQTVAAHGTAVTWMEHSADRTRLLTGSRDGTARIWDATSLRPLRSIEGPSALWRAIFAEEDRRVVTTDTAGRLSVYDARSGDLHGALQIAPAETVLRPMLTVDPRQGRVVVAASDKVLLIDVEQPAVVRTFDAGGALGAGALDVAPAAGLLAAGNASGEVKVWSLDGGRLAWSSRVASSVRLLGFDRTGTRLVVGGDKGEVVVLEAATGHRLATSTLHVAPVTAIAISRSGKLLATGAEDGSVRVSEVESGALRWGGQPRRAAIWSLVFSADDDLLLGGGSDGAVSVWATLDGSVLGQLSGHRGAAIVRDVHGDTALTSGDDGTLRVWSLRALRPPPALEVPSDVTGLTVTADGAMLLAGSYDGTISAWSLPDRALKWRANAHLGPAVAVAIAHDGGTLLAAAEGSSELRALSLPALEPIASMRTDGVPFEWFQPSSDGARTISGHPDGSVRVWETATGRRLHELKGPRGYVWGMAITRDGREAATSGADPRVVLWDLAHDRQRLALEGHRAAVSALCYSPDERLVLTSSEDHTAKTWDRATGSPVVTFEGHRGAVRNATFRADGELVATVAADGALRVWSARTGRMLAEWNGRGGVVGAVTFAPTGDQLFTGGEDRVVRQWDVRPSRTSVAEVERLVRCKVGYSLSDGRLVARSIETAACSD